MLFFFFILFIISSIASTKGIFSDTPNEFFRDFHHIVSNNDNPFSLFAFKPYPMPRDFSWLIHRFIYIVFYPFFTKSILVNLNLYTFSLLVMPFIMLILNFIIAKRTKRFDIAIFAFALYSLFSIPYISWLARELQIAIMLQTIFLQFFLSKKTHNYTKSDLFFYSLFTLFLFKSFENIIFIGPMFFVFGFISYIKNKENKKRYLLLGIFSLFACLYVVFKDFLFLYENQKFILSSYGSSMPWNMYFHSLKGVFIYTPIWISIVGIIILLIITYKNRFFKPIDIFWVTPIIILTLGYIFFNTKFVPYPSCEYNLFLCQIIFSSILFFIILIFDYFDFIFNKFFLNNLIIISCIVGILHFSWQINSSLYCYKYKKFIISVLEKCDKPFVTIHIDPSMTEYNYAAHNGYIFRSLILSKNKKIKTFILPDLKHIDRSNEKDFEYRELCYVDNEDYSHFLLISQYFQPKSKYWDLSDMAKVFLDLDLTEKSLGKYTDDELLDYLRANNKLYEWKNKTP